ncbi:hypothetical protein [Bowmanella denitrificans]|uniref:hypothetical protein n=1 Tax=Bowmanella denitrificans TaxID=366582 RepID=UPI000C9ACD2A|nr:hypothetical protein [Bowmanella denitrificans]
MQLNSKQHLQITGILELAENDLLFKASYSKNSPLGNQNETLLIRQAGTTTSLLRAFDTEIKILLSTPNNGITAISSFGDIYMFDGQQWQDQQTEPEDPEYIFAALAWEDDIYACCTLGKVMKFNGQQWQVLSDDLSGEELDTYDLCMTQDGLVVCGEDGLLVCKKPTGSDVYDIPTNVSLMSIVQTRTEELACVGRKGTMLIGSKDSWSLVDTHGIEANLSDITRWREHLYVSANQQILEFDQHILINKYDIPSFNVISLSTSLWSIGLQSLHQFDGQNWQEIIIHLDLS